MVTIGTNWVCPYCGHAQVVSEKRCDWGTEEIAVQGEETGEPVALEWEAVVCANDECRKLSLSVQLGNYWTDANRQRLFVRRESWTLLPPSSAKPQPDHIPSALRETYYKACKIRDLSPKASATMARRCLQGMIRDFCKIAKGTLDAEIRELRSEVDQGKAPAGVTPESVDAIDQVRSIGTIGAHMQKDIDLIIDVDPGEAQALIELIELLFDEWYTARYQRQQRLNHIAAIAADKKEQIAEAKAKQAHQKAGDEKPAEQPVFVQTAADLGK